jgi:DNA primase
MQKELMRLLYRLRKVKQIGDEYQACCPAHDDKRPSLSVGVAADGKVLVRCHTGCKTEDVVRVVGLDMKDLFPRNLGKSS